MSTIARLLFLGVILFGSVAPAMTKVMANVVEAPRTETGLDLRRYIEADVGGYAEIDGEGDTAGITLAFIGDPKSDVNFRWVELVYIEVFRRLNIPFRYNVYPPSRASMMANSGRVDGEAARVADYAEKFNNLVRIEEPIVSTHFSAFSHRADIKLTRWADLQDTSYRVEYRRGIFITEKRLVALVPSDKLTIATYPLHGLKRLMHDRIDIYIGAEFRIIPLLKRNEFNDAKIHMVGRLETFDNFGYLHMRHHKLAGLIAEVLKTMRAEGLMQKYLNQADREFLLMDGEAETSMLEVK
ncbi:hypothetical protein FM037_07855 [Shewanella psychropiezotolerans]|uniref:Solute-binding protein family 3/N-terminal domain-containing protein n=1 Tax=Shewanella psychropiezotolerans TaxID=2593655 RepID=A0ABX5WVM9_9GAMM|nr:MULTISPECIES: hypothetical protein [Shewanella]MPY22537.1 hypothetical protein [Shewanella sp. YLB-07]QDO83155.1 hypothetical protein FM037_07855 [Shewanella psychropiezotolerans]